MPKLLNNSILLQTFLALAFDLGGILSGRLALAFYPLFQSAPWILTLYPPLLSVRGNIGGIFSGKLSTMLHMGEAEPNFTRNTKQFYSLLSAIFFLTFVNSIGSGLIAYMLNAFLGNVAPSDLPLFIMIPSLTSLLAMAISIPLVLFIGINTFKRGLDPSILLYPAMSTIDDILITVCYVFVIGLTLLPEAISGMSTLMFILAVIFFLIFTKFKGKRIFRRTLVEGGPMVLFASLWGVFAGLGLASLREKIENIPSVLMLYPALIDTLGDIGSILGSRETTKLALGYFSSFRQTLRETITDLISVETAAASMHIVFGFATFLLGIATGLFSDPIFLLKTALISNLISFLFISIFSLFIATKTFQKGLDPDNFVIPAVTSVSDVGATLALMATLSILQV